MVAARARFNGRGDCARGSPSRRTRHQSQEREQQVFALRFDEGLPHAAITDQTGLTASQVKTTEAKLRVALLKHLKRNGYLDGREARVAPLGITPEGDNQ